MLSHLPSLDTLLDVGAVVGAILVLGFLALEHFFLGPRRLERRHGDRWRAHVSGAYHPQLSEKDERGVRTVRRVATEMRSDGGRLAVRLQHGGSGIVIHEINRSGEFARRGPYYIKLRPCIWEETGRRHLIEAIRPPGGFPTSNPAGGTTREVGSKILEFDTARYAPLKLRDFAAREERLEAAASRVTIARTVVAGTPPTPEQFDLSPAQAERWKSTFAAPFGKHTWVIAPATYVGAVLWGVIAAESGTHLVSGLAVALSPAGVFALIAGIALYLSLLGLARWLMPLISSSARRYVAYDAARVARQEAIHVVDSAASR